MTSRRLALVLLSLAAAACGAGAGRDAPAPELPRWRAPAAVIAAAHRVTSPSSRASVLPADASPVTFARMGKYPEPGWHVARSIRPTPDGTAFTYLASESGDETMALHVIGVTSADPRVLLRAADLPAARPRSREEELRRERTRERAEGISAYRWAKRAPVLVVPHGGDVFVRDERGHIERLTDTPEPELDAQPCATGARIAYVRKSELVVYDRATKREAVLTTGATEGVTHGLTDFNGQEELGEESGFTWSPRCDRLTYLEVDERKVAQIPVLGYRGGDSDLMMQRYPRAGATNPSVRLGILDVATRRTTWVKWSDASERYMVRLTWADDGNAFFLQTLTRDQKTRALVRVDASTGAVTELARETSEAWVSPAALRLLPKTGELLLTTDAGSHRHLEVRRASDGAVVRTLTRGAWDVTGIVAVDEDAGTVLFTGSREGPLERHLYAVSLAGGEPARLTRERGVHAITSDERGHVVVDVHSARDRAPRAEVLSLRDRSSPPRVLPSRVDPDVSDLGLRAPDLLEIRSPGGETLHAALLRPRHVVPGARHPALIVVYGGPTAQAVTDAWAPRLLWQHLADRGFFVFQLDNRGSTGRGPGFERLVHGRLGELELEDQLAGAAWLSALPEVDPTRIGIYGHSYGGFMAALAMTKAAGRFAAGVASAPVTDWRLYDSAYTERYMGMPAENEAGYAAADVAKLAARLEGRLMLIHANMDENVHYAHTARLVDALVAADKRFDLLVLPGERHGYRRPAARAYVNERVAAFFAGAL